MSPHGWLYGVSQSDLPSRSSTSVVSICFRPLLQKTAQHPGGFFVELDALGEEVGGRFVAG